MIGNAVDIKTLAACFREGTTRIAAALRELETYGYLRRERTRVPGGRIVTRTVCCDQPGRHGDASAAPSPRAPARRAATAPRQKPHAATPRSPPRRAESRAPLPHSPPGGHRRPHRPPPHAPRLLLSATDAEHLQPPVRRL
ncbi:hypothetical protein [Streptomyces sp. NPDC053069]|uniref:hypothetical protein n=1 Tax=Streptomyces sp. NPDC053069 TaxID=3365695 RepID=UPI0037D37691